MIVVTAASVVSAVEDDDDDVLECPDCASDENPAYSDEFGTTPADITTQVTIIGCGDDDDDDAAPSDDDDDAINTPPTIKCKWEYDLDVHLDCDPCDDLCCYEHDACPWTDGLQVKPLLGSSVTVGYYAVVTDLEQVVADVDEVYADVWHPDFQFKYQIPLYPVGWPDNDYDGIPDMDDPNAYDPTVALDLWDHVLSCHPTLITYNEVWALGVIDMTPEADIEHELEQAEAYIYYGEADISYCQPGGKYLVGVRAVDLTNSWSDWLYNRFWYIPTSAIEVDFNTIQYGDVAVSTEKWVGGDTLMTTPSKPTVKNIGNTPVEIYVWQDDMGFSSDTNPDGSESWNVIYDARLTADGLDLYYYPYQFQGDVTPDDPSDDYPGVRIPGIVGLCTQEKLDFSIHVLKGQPLTYTGQMELYACINELPYWLTPSQHVGTAQTGVPQINMP
jgi:hypothetical protein